MTTDIIQQIADAELALIKAPLTTLLTTLQNPTANFLTVANAGQNLMLQIPQLSGPAQSVLINLTATALLAKLNTIGATSAAVTPAA